MTRPNAQLAALENSYGEMLALCDALETVADSLPHAINPRICRTLAGAIEPLMARIHQLEEDALFPLMAASQTPDLSNALTRLRAQHIADGSAAAEVSEGLHALAAQTPQLSPDATGYLLRSFFEGMRRHIPAAREFLALAQAR